MSAAEDFENAPIGATATNPDGRRAVKTRASILGFYYWVTSNGINLRDEEMEECEYELDPKERWEV